MNAECMLADPQRPRGPRTGSNSDNTVTGRGLPPYILSESTLLYTRVLAVAATSVLVIRVRAVMEFIMAPPYGRMAL